MQENKETTRVVKCLKKATAGVLSAVMVFTGMPAITGITAKAATIGMPDPEDGVINLTEDVILNESYSVDGGTLSINLNGYTLSLNSSTDGSVIEVINGANVTINGGANKDDDSVSGTISGGDGHADGSHREGGGIYVKDSALTLNNVIISDNHTTDYQGGGVYAEDSALTIKGCLISNNSIAKDSSQANGGGIFAYNCGDVEISDTIFSRNIGHEGGGLEVENCSNTVISNCVFEDNTAYAYGGGLHIWAQAEGGTTIVKDCVFTGNTAATHGGAVYASGSAGETVSFEGCQFEGNSAEIYGGGVAVANTVLVAFKDCDFIKNSVYGDGTVYGGGVYFVNYEEGSTIIDGCTFMENSSTNMGGAIAIYTNNAEGSFSIVNSTIKDNTAYGGGGIFAQLPANDTLTISGTQIIGNTADGSYGGGMYLSRGIFVIDDTSIVANNTSDYSSADIAKTSSASLTLFDAAKMNMVFEADGKGQMIDGWYADSHSSRYTPSNSATKYDNVLETGSSAYVIAAYGYNTYEVDFLPGDYGTLPNEAEKIDFYVKEGTALSEYDDAEIPEVTPNAGYNFTGWLGSDGNMYSDEEALALEIYEDEFTFTAQYSVIEDEYFDIDEEIVPDRKENDRDSWTDSEEVSEYTSIEIEMSTTLPVMSQAHLNELTSGEEFTMVFHNILDDDLKLDSEEDTDLHITIGDKKIDHKYYSIDISDPSDVWTLSAQSAGDDGCTFHVTVDLKALFEDGEISADDFTGETEIIVFFYADLEDAEYGEEYTSEVWYGVYDETEEPIHLSDVAIITVYVLGSEPEPEDSDYGVLTVTKKVENNPTDTTSYKFTLLLEDEGTYEVETSENESVETSSNASRAESDSDALRLSASKESADETVVVDEYEYTIRNANNSKAKSGIITLAANTSDKATKLIEFELKDGQKMVVHGLPEGMKYTVTEISKSNDYTTSAVSDSEDEIGTDDGCVYVAGITEADGNVTVTYTNAYETSNDDDEPDTQPGPGPAEEEPFEFTKTSSRGETTVSVGTNLTYTISYKNDTDETATITIVDPLDAGLTYSSASDGGVYDSSNRTVTWTIEDVKPGEEGSVTVTARVNYTGRTEGRVTNTAELTVEGLESGTYEANASTSNTVSRTTSTSSGSGSSGSSSSGSSSSGNVTNVNTGKTGHWILEGGYLTLPDGSHPSNEYLNVDGEVWAFYTYGYAVAKRHTEYYTSAALAAVGYIPEVTGTWETIGWWFEYDDGTYPHDEWAQLEYNGKTYWYHFDVDGWMDDGWFIDKNGDTYYLDPVYDGWRGHMMTGWQEIGGSWYYFSEDPNSLGVMLKDTTTPDGFKVDANGRYIE